MPAMSGLSRRTLELAVQQFEGYRHAQAGYSIQALADSMGLTASEWDAVRAESPLTEQDKQALDKHFTK